MGSKYNRVHQNMSKNSAVSLRPLFWFLSLLHVSVGAVCVICFQDSFSQLQLNSLSSSLSFLFSVCVCVCVSLLCTHANYAGVFVTEKNALKLSFMSVKTKQMVFLQPSEKKKMLWQQTSVRFTCCCRKIANVWVWMWVQ